MRRSLHGSPPRKRFHGQLSCWARIRKGISITQETARELCAWISLGRYCASYHGQPAPTCRGPACSTSSRDLVVARRFCASRRGERRSPQGRTPFGPTCWLRLCRAVALVPNFFVSCEEFLRSSLGPGWLELPIFDCRFSIADGHWKELSHCFFNRQSAIVNRQSAIGNQQSAMKTSSLVAAVPVPENRFRRLGNWLTKAERASTRSHPASRAAAMRSFWT